MGITSCNIAEKDTCMCPCGSVFCGVLEASHLGSELSHKGTASAGATTAPALVSSLSAKVSSSSWLAAFCRVLSPAAPACQAPSAGVTSTNPEGVTR